MAKFQDNVELLITARNTARAALQEADADAKAQAAKESANAKAAERRARELADVERQIQQQSLRNRGRALDAQLADIREHYRERIAAAKRANDEELADRLKTLRQLREIEARNADENRQQQEKRDRIRVRANRFTESLGIVAAFAAGAELVSGAIDTVGAVIRGDFEAVAERLERIPAFGSLVRAGQSIREVFTGEAAEIEKLNKRVAEGNKLFAERQKLIDANRQAESQIDALRDELRLLNEGSEIFRQRINITREREQRIESIVRLLQKAEGIGRADAEREARQLALAIERKKLEEQRAATLERIAAQRRDTASIETEIEQRRLRAAGNVLEAELKGIRTEFAERIRVARESGNIEKAFALQRLREVRQEEARLNEERRREAEREREDQKRADEQRNMRLQAINDQQDAARRDRNEIQGRIQSVRDQLNRSDAPEIQANQNRFLTGVRERSQQLDRERKAQGEKQIQVLEQQLARLEGVERSLVELAASIKDGPRLVGVDQL